MEVVDVNTREVEGALIVDLFGQFPHGKDEIHSLADAIRDAIVEQSNPIVFNMPDADRLTSIHIGVLLRAIKAANVQSSSFSIVSPRNSIREIFQVVDGLFRAYETEAEALNPRGGQGCFLMVIVTVLSSLICVIWLSAG
jgi:anti-anti-sigma factor